MNERLKEIRKSMNMNQTEFANLLGVGQSTLAMMEVSKRDISERHIKTICAICKVNETWLRTGEGEMFEDNGNDFIAELSSKHSLDPLEQAMMRSVYEMTSDQRKAVLAFARRLVAECDSIPEESDDERTVRIVRAARADADSAESNHGADKRA